MTDTTPALASLALLDATDLLHRALRAKRVPADLAPAVETLMHALGEYDYQRRELSRLLAAAQASGASVVGIDAAREAMTR